MISEISLLASVALATAFGGQSSIPMAIKDQEEIQALEHGLEDAWNQHNPKAFANLFTEDADHVNLMGWRWKGRAAIEMGLINAHAYVFKDSVLSNQEIDVKLLDSHTGIVHIVWSMTGQKGLDGNPAPPVSGLETQIVRKGNGQWLIAAFHNTKSVPEISFPLGPTQK